MIYVIRKAHFNASHRLHNSDKSEKWNQDVFGKCNNPNWHGHNYFLEVTVAGKPDDETGYVIDLGELKKIIEEKIIEPCDHKNLNMDVPFLKGIIPTAENLAKKFYEQLKKPVEEAVGDESRLYSVKLYETERNSAEYCPEPRT